MPAGAELRMVAGATSPASISFPGPAPLVYALQLTAEGRDETFALQFDAPFFGRDLTGTAQIGAALTFTGQRPRIEGPAQLLIKALPKLVGRGQGTLSTARQVTVRGPRTSGSWGVHLTLRSTPKTVTAGRLGAARVRIGQRIAIRGTTRPRLVGKTVALWVRTRAKPWLRLVKMVRIDPQGRFHAAVRARHGLQVMARIAAPGPMFTPEVSCPLRFNVRR